jgi:pyruvate dehydrogenase E1 component
MIGRWVTGRPFVALGTDGFGRSDTRENLRRHFEVDAEHVVATALWALQQQGAMKPEEVAKAIKELGINPEAIDPRDA